MKDATDAMPAITQDLLDRAAFQYARITIATIGDLCVHPGLREKARDFPQYEPLLDECLAGLTLADAVLRPEIDPASSEAIAAYRAVDAAVIPFGTALTGMRAYMYAATMPETKRNLDAFEEDPIAYLERRFGMMSFNLRTYLHALDSGIPAEQALRRRF